MSYREPITQDTSLFSIVNKEARAAVAQAVANGKKVEWEFSSFSDPGDDWQQVRVDDAVVPGSRQGGY